MTRTQSSGAFVRVLSFAASLWLRRRGHIAALVLSVLTSTGADIAIPVFTGRLVSAVADGTAPWPLFAVLLALGAVSLGAKVLSFVAIIDLTIPTMRAAESEAFAHVQRLPADWHANAFAGSTVRKITRGPGRSTTWPMSCSCRSCPHCWFFWAPSARLPPSGS